MIFCNPTGTSLMAYEEENGADDEVRTRDIQIGNLKLYQLSYVRAELSDTKLCYVRQGGGANIPGCLPKLADFTEKNG